MPDWHKKTPERALMGRGFKRKNRHGNWRQHYIDCSGMCVRCGSLENLEFHAPLGEMAEGQLKFMHRVLLCTECHLAVDDSAHVFTRNGGNPSLLQTDVAWEVTLAGGYSQWLERYNLIRRTLVIELEQTPEEHEAEMAKLYEEGRFFPSEESR